MQSNFQTRYESSQILTEKNQAKRIQGFDHRSLQKKSHSQYFGKYFPNAISSSTHSSTDPSEDPITNMILIVWYFAKLE